MTVPLTVPLSGVVTSSTNASASCAGTDVGATSRSAIDAPLMPLTVIGVRLNVLLPLLRTMIE